MPQQRLRDTPEPMPVTRAIDTPARPRAPFGAFRRRLARQGGFTLIEVLMVLVILGILLAIAIPGYLVFKDRAGQKAAEANVRSAITAVETYSSDNDGSAGDIDANAATTGYQGMTIGLLQGIDAGIKLTTVTSLTTSSYCVDFQGSGGKSASKTAPSGPIVQTACP
jgi:prepilin-type N-terminal cleavage/methylation domain-containing protein